HQFFAVELGGVGDPGDVGAQLIQFLTNGVPLGSRIGIVGALHGQLAHPLQVIGDLLIGAVDDVQDIHAVLDVIEGFFGAADLGSEVLADLQTGGVIARSVDAEAGGQLLYRSGQGVGVGA